MILLSEGFLPNVNFLISPAFPAVMAETAAVPAPAPASADKKKFEKPEKPNADLFNEQLAKAEKEYQEAFAKYVRGTVLNMNLT